MPLSRLLPRYRPFGKPTDAANDIEALVENANRARDDGDWNAAVSAYSAAIEAGAGAIGLHVQLGHALKELGDYPAAEAAYRVFLAERPFDPDIHLQMGHLFNRQDDVASALEWYAGAARLAPLNLDIANHLADARKRLGNAAVTGKRSHAMELVAAARWHEALPLLEELVTHEGQRDLIGILANVTKETGALEAAAGHYDTYRNYALAEAPELLPDVDLQIGHLHKISGDYRGALKHYARARQSHIEQTGYVPEGAPYNHEISACINAVYTCFWTDPFARAG